MNVTFAAKVRHMRTTEDIDAIISRAQVRQERRGRAITARAGWLLDTPAVWHELDLYHENARLLANLEDKRRDREDAYQQMEDRFL